MSDTNTVYSTRLKFSMVIVIIYSLLRIVVAAIEFFEIDIWDTISNVEIIFISLVASLSLFYTALRFESGSRNRNLMFLLGIGYLFWFIGEAAWAYFELATDIEPFPSIADVFYLGAYLPIIYAIYWKSRTTLISPEKKRVLIMFSLLTIFTVLSALYVMIPILEDDSISSLEKYVSLAYPILDIILLVAVSLLLSKYAGGKMEKSWLIYSLSAFTTAIADTYFAYDDWNGTYTSYSFCNSLFIIAYLLVIPFTILFRETYN